MKNKHERINGLVYIYFPSGGYTIINEEDFDLVFYSTNNNWLFYANDTIKTPYSKVYEEGKQKKVFLSHVIAGKPPTLDLVIDHKDGDPLNNTRENLRMITKQQNMFNREAKNVYWDTQKQKYRVSVIKDGKQHYFGLYSDAEIASEVAKKARKDLFGEYDREESSS